MYIQKKKFIKLNWNEQYFWILILFLIVISSCITITYSNGIIIDTWGEKTNGISDIKSQKCSYSQSIDKIGYINKIKIRIDPDIIPLENNLQIFIEKNGKISNYNAKLVHKNDGQIFAEINFHKFISAPFQINISARGGIHSI